MWRWESWGSSFSEYPWTAGRMGIAQSLVQGSFKMTKDLELTPYGLEDHFRLISLIWMYFLRFDLALFNSVICYEKFSEVYVFFHVLHQYIQRQASGREAGLCLGAYMCGWKDWEWRELHMKHWCGRCGQAAEEIDHIQVSYVDELILYKDRPTICWVWRKGRESCSIAFESPRYHSMILWL